MPQKKLFHFFYDFFLHIESESDVLGSFSKEESTFVYCSFVYYKRGLIWFHKQNMNIGTVNHDIVYVMSYINQIVLKVKECRSL